MNGAVERSGSLGQAKDLAAGAGETVDLNGNGYFEHRPHPSMKAFENVLATWLAARLCAGCGKPRGYGQPVIALDHRFYHPPCGRIADAARSRRLS